MSAKTHGASAWHRLARASWVAAITSSCVPVSAAEAPLPPPTEQGRASLETLRASAAIAVTRRIAIELREPKSGKILSARGAVAIAPPRSLRMILLGPGGTTALDLWIDGGRYRFFVPAIDLKKRGELSGPREERRGLPVDFLAAWLLHPARGDLVGYARDAVAERFVLQDETARVRLTALHDGRIELSRETFAPPTGTLLDEETISAGGIGCSGAHYHQRSTGLDVTVTCEGETRQEPSPRAFADPDATEAR